MSDFEMRDGQAFLFANKAEGNKPVFKGSLKLDGVEYELAYWPSKSGKEGSFSGTVKKKVPYDGTHKGFTAQGDVAPASPLAETEIAF